MKKIAASSLVLLASVAPAVAFAQFGTINTFIGKIATFVNQTLIPLILTIALLVFVYGMFEYFIRGGADEGKRAEGRGLIIGAVVGFVAMVVIWGVVNLVAGGVKTGLGTDTSTLQNVPTGPNVQ